MKSDAERAFEQAAARASGTAGIAAVAPITGPGIPSIQGVFPHLDPNSGLGALSPAPAYGLTVIGAALLGGSVAYAVGRTARSATAGALLQGGVTAGLVGIWGKSLDSTAYRVGFGLLGLVGLGIGGMMVRRR